MIETGMAIWLGGSCAREDRRRDGVTATADEQTGSDVDRCCLFAQLSDQSLLKQDESDALSHVPLPGNLVDILHG